MNFSHFHLDGVWKQVSNGFSGPVSGQAVTVLGEAGVIPHRIIHAQANKPTEEQIELDMFDQLPLRANAVQGLNQGVHARSMDDLTWHTAHQIRRVSQAECHRPPPAACAADALLGRTCLPANWPTLLSPCHPLRFRANCPKRYSASLSKALASFRHPAPGSPAAPCRLQRNWVGLRR
jgi:hypothetical protein